MGELRRKPEICPIDKHCSEWAIKYMGYCLCSTKDGFSLALGLISVLTWSVAEIPQIITNYRENSAEGLSIVFLSTWIVGDFFNLAGCMLEPATLPTQYYTAVLYTVTSLVLASQSVYYGNIKPRLKFNKRRQQEDMERKRDDGYSDDTEKSNNEESFEGAPSSPVPVASNSPTGFEEIYFMSARSLSVSHTPPAGSFLTGRTPTSDVERPLLGEARPPQTAATPPKIKTMLCVVSLMTFFIGSCNNQLAANRENGNDLINPTGGVVFRVGRRLLEATIGSAQETLGSESSRIGSFLGWGMAVIYVGGRLPQICLNIRKGNAEGLNPLMFVFAIVGNTTYVASILVNSISWVKVKPNLPWLVDAAGCVLLDAFILTQFIYFRYRSRTRVDKYVS
ncbi:hypothetical protein ACP275_10G151600 [Erythranthe tilingii]